MKKLILLKFHIVLLCFLFMIPAVTNGQFVKRNGHQFELDNQPLYYVGANLWYGNLLPLEKDSTKGIDRLINELDFLQSKGISNLRVIAGAEGSGLVAGVPRIGPPLQPEKGVFNQDLLKGLDVLLAEMGKRNMKAVIYLSNNWEWSGGFLQYLKWNGMLEDSIFRNKMNWDEMRDNVSKFYGCTPCVEDYWKQVKEIINHTNTVTQKKYINDPVIMAWQLANEPRPMRPNAISDYKKFIKNSAALIKSLDSNHLVSLGVEGYMGTENLEVFESIHDDNNVDYLTIHIWPKNWAWFTGKEMGPHMDTILGKTMNYIYEHENIARKLNKPLVIEEFGMPRNGISFNIDTPVTYRDIYFKTILNEWAKNKHAGSVLAGINFWAYGGTAQPIKDQLFWKKGDPYMGDPPMEEQGLYSVFNSDTTTWKVIEDEVKDNHQIYKDLPSDTQATPKTISFYRNLKTLLTKGFMFGHQDDLAYGVGWRNIDGKSDVKEITGEYPGVYGWELGNIEHDSASNIDGISFNKMKEYIRTGYERGGVISISWHADNPLNLKSAWDTTPGSVAAILPGGLKHAVYKSWLDKVAAFLSDLKDKDGEPIPVLFRPFHEFTGNWFWWCRNNTSAEEFKSLWKFTVEYLRNERNLHHILYVYNTADFDSPAAYLEYYPGDDLVDVLSFDIYQTGDPVTDSSFYKRLDKQLGILDNISFQKNKIPAVAETGFDNIPDKTWWTKTLLPVLRVHRVSFVLVWRNAGLMNNGKMHYYVPYKEDISARDFINFYNSPGVLFEKKTKAAKLYQPLSLK